MIKLLQLPVIRVNGSHCKMAFRMTANASFEWNLNELCNGSPNDVAMLLNYGLASVDSRRRVLFERIWSTASVKIAVDGGTDYLNEHDARPDVVCGDLDSVNKDLLEKYARSGDTKVIELPDQDETDFTKSVGVVMREFNAVKKDKIVTFMGSAEARIDHMLANINTLYKFKDADPFLPIFLVSSCKSLSWLLDKGSHLITSRHSSRWCSLVPVGHPAVVTSSGLRWDLNNHRMSFGQLISTSNEFDPAKDVVSVITDHPILFSMDFNL